jgi:dissimilatory sulfite reductase alpha subunit
VYRIGMGKFLREVGMEAVPQMVYRPRANPYVFWPQEEIFQEAAGQAEDQD